MQAVARSSRALRAPQLVAAAGKKQQRSSRAFSAATRLAAVKPFLLADIGEGIKEVQIIQWFVQPGARVEQFDKICEVQSDKASVDITSRFDGVIKKLHYDADAMAQVGKPLLDIDITGDVAPADEKLLQTEDSSPSESTPSETVTPSAPATTSVSPPSTRHTPTPASSRGASGHSATPAVRGLLKELGVELSEVQGTGRDGRVLKEDVQRHVAVRDAAPQQTTPQETSIPTRPAVEAAPQTETPQALTPIQSAMHKAMTRSLAIPHFLCSDEVDLTALTALRHTLNASATGQEQKLSALAFIIKAVSLTLHGAPVLNARLSSSSPPQLVQRTQHNVSVAIDSPFGLVAPNIKSVQALSVAEIASELRRLQGLAQRGKLSVSDLTGGTISVSNIGSIGGTHATPLLVDDQLAILAVGRAQALPRFALDGSVVRRDVAVFNWQADHRVIDGATLARMGKGVRDLLEEPGRMLVGLR